MTSRDAARLGAARAEGARIESAVLRPVRGHHAFEACVERVATAIRLGIYPEDSSLPAERELATRLGVSRATVREAIAALREAGLVETRRGRGGGTVVRHSPDAPGEGTRPDEARLEELRDALELRRVVEAGAVELAARRGVGAEDRTHLEEALAQTTAAAGEPALHRQADSRLHLALAASSRSERLLAAVTAVQADLHEMLSAIPVLRVNIEHSCRQHAAIVRAVLAGDGSRARLVMEAHCDDTAALLRGLLTGSGKDRT